MKLCAIEPKELEEKILIRFAENQNDELLEDLSDYVINSQKEIERLNNVIDELEKWVKEDKECFETQFYMGRCVNFQCILDKIQELKGVDKE